MLADRPLEIAELTVSTAPIVLKQAIDPHALRPFERIADAFATTSATSATAATAAGGGLAVYLSRARLGGNLRRARNEVEIEAVVAARGFQVLHPQEMSISEQVAAMRGADVVAGCDGSALHLAAFARPGTTLVALDSRVVENQLMIDIARGLNAVHVPASVDGITQRDEPWTADPRPGSVGAGPGRVGRGLGPTSEQLPRYRSRRGTRVRTIVVLGMHRSGTSALVRAMDCSERRWDLATTFVETGRIGSFATSTPALEAGGGDWDDPPSGEDWIATADTPALRDLAGERFEQELGESGVVV